MKAGPEISIVDQGDHFTILNIGTKGHPFSIQKFQVDNYRASAKKLLDELSTEYNAMGINSLIGALVYEHINGYNGKDNE